MLLDLVIALLLLAGVLTLVALAASALFALPLADWINRVLRQAGLAGPAPGSRSIGSRVQGRVAEPFHVREGAHHGDGRVFIKDELWNARCPVDLAGTLREEDEVEVVFNDDLTVTVVDRASS